MPLRCRILTASAALACTGDKRSTWAMHNTRFSRVTYALVSFACCISCVYAGACIQVADWLLISVRNLMC
jgi:hypothetical protein